MRLGVLAVVIMVLLVPSSIAFSQEPTQVGPSCRNPKDWKPPDEKLAGFLDAHKKWLESGGVQRGSEESPPRRLCNLEHTAKLLKGRKLRLIDLSGAYLSSANLSGADLRSADLSGADLVNAHLREADLTWANLSRAKLDRVDFRGADLAGADLSGAELFGTDFGCLETKYRETKEEDCARLKGAILTGALFQPEVPPQARNLLGSVGLHTVRFNPQYGFALVHLREDLKKSGLRGLEREATHAIEANRTRHLLEKEPVDDSNELTSTFERLGWTIEGGFRKIVFDWTVGYGLYYGRPLWVIFGLAAILGLLVYPFALARKSSDELIGIFRVWQSGRLVGEPNLMEAKDSEVEKLHSLPLWKALEIGMYFSLLSAFHIGWRDLNVGSWIARMQGDEYVLRGRGWVRRVSGAQSVLSVILLAFWAIFTFGRPFD